MSDRPTTRDANDPAARSAALDVLARGGCVAVPTETVYGLAADATNGRAVARVFEMKGRPRFNPLIAHVSGLDMAARHGVLERAALALAEAFWPGPLTLVVPLAGASAIHPLVTAGLGTVGLRCPQGVTRELIETLGRPLAAPSANRSGRISPTTAAHVVREFAGTDLLILDAGACPVGLESTVVRVLSGAVEILRPGAIEAGALEAVARLPVRHAVPEAAIAAPGMMASHYAPDTPLRLGVTDCPEGAGLLAFGPGEGRDRSRAAAVRNLSPAGDLREAAARLYGDLAALDEAGLPLLCAEPVPAEGLGLAILDRLSRAAAPRAAA